MNINRLLNAASDCVIRFRSSHFPLKTVANDVIRAKKLNSSERKVLLELVFAWSREANLVHEFLLSKIRFYKSSPKQNQDILALNLLANRFFTQESTAKMATEYEKWLLDLGNERYLKSLAFIGEALKKDHGQKASAIAEGLFTKAKKYLAFDERFLSLDNLKTELKKLGIEAESHGVMSKALAVDQIKMDELPKTLAKHTWLMDAGSQIIADLFQVKPQDEVLDMCAGEGGKALLITEKDCHYVAMDIDGARLKVAKERLVGRKVEFIEADACAHDFKERKFDWILLDAPCSGTGVLRRNPDLIYRLDQKSISNYIKLQSKLLDKAVQLLKPQGKLIYATCSLFKAENEEQIERVLRINKEIMALPLNRLVGERLNLNAEVLINSCLTLYPHIHDCDGFFFAALTKTPS